MTNRCATDHIAQRPWRENIKAPEFSRGGAEVLPRGGAETLELDEITGAILDASLRIHREIGPGLLESLYVSILARELRRRGLHVERERVIRFSYDGSVVEDAFRADLFVEECVIVEVKSVERFAPVHQKQLLTYLRLTNLRVDLLLNFGAETMKEGVKRVVNNYTPSTSSLLRVNRPR